MHKLLLVSSLATAIGALPADRQRFEDFKRAHGRAYAADEEARRFDIFVANLRTIDALNAEPGSAVHGVNKFADLSPEEFSARHKSAVRPEAGQASGDVHVLDAGAAPTMVDWRTKGLVTKVKDQGNCGSCWAFSAVEQIESDWLLAGHPQVILSEQEVVSCDRSGQDSGCNGGDTVTAYKYIEKAGGLVTEPEYPYDSGKSGKTGPCKLPSGDKKSVTLSGFKWYIPPCNSGPCTAQNETALMMGIGSRGPASICVNADNAWQSYQSGVFSHKCPAAASKIDHCVQLVGYNFADSSNQYWIVRNSWNTDWGVDGYMYLKAGENLCSVASYPSYTLVEAVNATQH